MFIFSKSVAFAASVNVLLAPVAAAAAARRQAPTAAPDCMKAETHKSTYVGQKSSFEILCKWDYAGGDYKAVVAPTFEDCIKACDAEEACIDVAYTFGNQNCYLKDVLTPAMATDWVHSARKSSKPTGVTCAGDASNGATYTGVNGKFEILCGVDYAGADIAAIQVANFEDCIKSCDNNDKCVDVSYDHNGKTCWTKDKLNTPNPAPGIWTAKRVVVPKVTTEVTCVGNAADGTTFKAATSSFQVLCGVDYGGGDLAAAQYETFEACMRACDVDDRCVDVSYDPGSKNCWTKGILNTLNPVAWIWTGKKIQDTTAADPMKPVISQLTCRNKEMNGKTFTAASGSEYRIICGQEYPGGDLMAADTPSFQACVELCDTTPGCIDVSYAGPACYLKDQLTQLGPADWISTALLVKVPTRLSCQNAESHDTTFTTKHRRQYDIQCGYDYFGGDMKMIYANTFELCLEACDENVGCIDVAYSGQACYLKETIIQKQAAGWVWNARYIGMAPVTSSFSSLSTSSSLTASVSSATPSISASKTWTTTTNAISATACASGAESTFMPSRDSDIDRFSDERLDTASEVSLNYAEVPGNRVMQVELITSKPIVVIENADQVLGVSCVNDTAAPEMRVEFRDTAVASKAFAKWTAGVIIVTNAAGCNLRSARGFWEIIVPQKTPSATDTAITYFVKELRIIDVATQITLVYGTLDTSGNPTFTSTTSNAASLPSAPAQTCDAISALITSTGSISSFATTQDSSSSYPSATASPTSASGSLYSLTTSSIPSVTASSGPRPLPQSLDDLTPAARELYDFLLASIKVENGNINYNVPPQKGQEIPVKPYDPNDLGDQQGIEDDFKNAGLDKPSDLLAKAAEGLEKVAGNICPSDPAIAKRELLRPYIQSRRAHTATLRARRFGSWLNSKLEARETDGWDIACDDTVTELVGGLIPGGKTLEAVCAGKSLYDNRDAIKCLFGGCKTTTYIVTTTTTYDFNYSWYMNFPTISQWLTMTGPNKVLSCVNCGFSVTSISFTGKIIVAVTNGNIDIKQADVTPGIAGTAYMIARLQADGAYKGSWNHNYKNADLGPIQMDGAFRINPTVLYGVGIEFSTDSKVDITGGARFSWSNANAPINILQSRLTSQGNWQPNVELTLPSFKQGASVSLKPYMRWVVKLKVDIYGMVHIEPSLTSQTVVGIDSTYSFLATAQCPANNLAVNTYVYSSNSVTFGDGNSAVLYRGNAASTKQCFAVPGITPSPEEIASLKKVGSSYCTKYLNYRPPSTFTYTTETSTVPRTTTKSVTTVVTTTETKYELVTTKYDSYLTRTFSARTTTVTASGRTAQFAYQGFKRSLGEPTQALEAPLVERQVVAQATPTMIKDWDATKISWACKQIATGTDTVTYTTSTTVTSGEVTATQTITRNANGPLVTVTNTIKSTRFMGIATATAPGTVATETVCPPSTVNTCFKIKVHGCPWVEDKYIRYHRYGSFQPESFYGTDYVFYLTPSGRLIGYIPGGPSMVLGTSYPYVSNNYWGEVYMKDMEQAWNGYQYATCKKDADPCSKGLTCSIIDAGGVERVGMSLQVPDFMGSSGMMDSGTSSNSFRPAWYKIPDTNYYKWLPFTMTYEDVPCPC